MKKFSYFAHVKLHYNIFFLNQYIYKVTHSGNKIFYNLFIEQIFYIYKIYLIFEIPNFFL